MPHMHHPAMYAVDDAVLTQEMRSQRGEDVTLNRSAIISAAMSPAEVEALELIAKDSHCSQVINISLPYNITPYNSSYDLS